MGKIFWGGGGGPEACTYLYTCYIYGNFLFTQARFVLEQVFGGVR